VIETILLALISNAQYNQVQPHMTRHHVQQVIFHGTTGIRIAKWADAQGDLHVAKDYTMKSGETADIIYRKGVHSHVWRVTHKEIVP